MKYVSLHDRLRGPIADALKKELATENIRALPRVEKIIVNVGINKTKMDSKELHEYIGETLAQITGQKPVVTKAEKSLAEFKLRKGNPIGCKATLRGVRMYEFLDRLVNVTLPRIKDFRGLSSKGFDEAGNYTLGIHEQLVFPEISPEDVEFVQGMDITIVISGKQKERSKELLRILGTPFRD